MVFTRLLNALLSLIQETTVVEAETSSSSFAEIDNLFSDIQNLLDGKSNSFQPPQLTNEEIANAKETFRQCINMKLANVIESGRAPVFKNSLSIMLTVNAFPNDVVHEMTKFLANFDRRRELYMSAQQDLREAKEKQNSVSKLKTTLKDLSLEFVPIRNRANEVDQEVARLERRLAERKEEKAQLKHGLEDLVGRASTSRQALIDAEQEMKLFLHKKEEAEGIVADIERLWESLKKN